jgi:6-phosphogluconolactonase
MSLPTPAAREVQVHDDLGALSRAAAIRLVAAAAAGVAQRGRFTVALSGGRTPRPLYELLAAEYRDRVPWAAVHVFFADERCVPADDPASNYGMVRAALLAHVPVAPAHVRRIAGERAPAEAASAYDARLREEFGVGGRPAFDVALLGVGADGHTASLFPGDPALAERDRLAVAVEGPPQLAPRERVSLTLPVLNRAREVLLLVAGADKHAVVEQILAGDIELPAARVRGSERTTWLLDRQAAGVRLAAPG